MYIKKNRKRSKPLLRKRTYRKKSTSKVTLATKRYVRKAISLQTEEKKVVIERAQTFGSILQDATLGAFPLCPYTSLFPLPIGTTNGTRVGNEIKVKKVMLRFVIRPTTYQAGVNDNPQPANIILYIGNYKQYKGILPTNLEVGQLYETGAGSSAP